MSAVNDMPLLSHNTPVTVALMIVLLSLAFGLGIVYDRIGQVEEDQARHERRTELLEKAFLDLKDMARDNKRRMDIQDRER